MNTANLLRRIRSALREIAGGYYNSTTTTGAGNAGGTNFVDTSITALDDFLNGKEVFIASGDAIGQSKKITDWDNGTNTATLESTAGWQIASGVSIEIGEPGFYSDREFLDWLNDGQDDMVNKLTDSALFKSLSTTANLSLSSGIATIPTDFVRPTEKYCVIDSEVAPIYSNDQYQKFLKSIWNIKRAYFRNGALEYRPTGAAVVTLEYIKDIAAITGAATSILDTELHQALIDYTVHRGFLKAEQETRAKQHLQEYEKKIAGYNQQHQDRML